MAVRHEYPTGFYLVHNDIASPDRGRTKATRKARNIIQEMSSKSLFAKGRAKPAPLQADRFFAATGGSFDCCGSSPLFRKSVSCQYDFSCSSSLRGSRRGLGVDTYSDSGPSSRQP